MFATPVGGLPSAIRPICGGNALPFPLGLYESIIGRLPAAPENIEGDLKGPRRLTSYPTSQEKRKVLIRSAISNDNAATGTIGRELLRHLFRLSGDRTVAFPPMALTAESLDAILRNRLSHIDDEYAVLLPEWVEVEGETTTNKLAKHCPGDITSFVVEYDGSRYPFILCPDRSDDGFSWYRRAAYSPDEPAPTGIDGDSPLVSEVKSLSSIVGEATSAQITQLPDWYQNAVDLLDADVSPSSRGLDIGNWNIHSCSVAGGDQTDGPTHYEAVFTHKHRSAYVRVAHTKSTTSDMHPKLLEKTHARGSDATRPGQTENYLWKIHFTPDSMTQRLQSTFDNPLPQDELQDLLKQADAELLASATN